ncbi:MAG: ATP-dependent DNA helicase [Betaproteobacteria bacterium]|nr:ATP-dependent DNA helicase [Betaproteobacteria bacterium]
MNGSASPLGLAAAVQEAFRADGVLSRADAGFRPRSGQTEMALAVAQTVEQGGSLVVEAGTGVGKTFAYLVPALLSGERVLVSTATKALQDQLFGRDLPRLAAAFGLPVRLALLKGRASYLCPHRLELARREALLPDRATVALLAKVERWAQGTRSGDLAELPGLDERSALLPLITSTRENCLGSECGHYRECPVMQARKNALAADIVVINHHLFFADLAVRETGMAELLPSVRVVVFDEAHQLNETGVQFLGQQLGSTQLIELARDSLAAGLTLAQGLVDWSAVSSALELSARDLRLLFAKSSRNSRLSWSGPVPEGIEPEAWQAGLLQVQTACEALGEGLELVVQTAPDFVRLQERVAEVLIRLNAFQAPMATGCVRWVEVGAQVRLLEAPLDIADTVRSRLLGADAPVVSPQNASWDLDASRKHHETADQVPAQDSAELAAQTGSLPRSWIFTSATLGDEPALRWFTEPCGLESARVLQVSSPFDYPRQAVLFVPRDMVVPSDPQHSQQVGELAARIVRVLGGRTLVLTTTLRALQAIGDQLQQAFAEDTQVQVLVQGQGSKRELMDRFRQGMDDAGRGCVLVASATFWEGFDVPGDALQAVIIDKLPFPPPNDPVVQARSDRLNEQGRSPFKDYFLPEAAVSLKQGAGRLIRRETDRGVLVVCDTRLSTTGYGRRLMAALPPMAKVSSQKVLLEGLARLTTASTRAS